MYLIYPHLTGATSHSMLVKHTLYRACGPPYDCTLRFKCMAWYVPSWMVCWPHVPAGRSSGSPTSQLINHQVASHLVVHSSHAMSNYFIADEGCNMIFFWSEENYDPIIPVPIFIKTAAFKHKKEESVYMHKCTPDKVYTCTSNSIQSKSRVKTVSIICYHP